LDRQALFLWKKWRGTLDWSPTRTPIFPGGSTTQPVIRLRPVQGEISCGSR
jgi:hypothetical protein